MSVFGVVPALHGHGASPNIGPLGTGAVVVVEFELLVELLVELLDELLDGVVVAELVVATAVPADVVAADELLGVDEPVAAPVVLITAVVAPAGAVVVAAATGAELAGVAVRSFPHAAPTNESTTQAVTRRVETVRMKVPPTTLDVAGQRNSWVRRANHRSPRRRPVAGDSLGPSMRRIESGFGEGARSSELRRTIHDRDHHT